jgi:hypothetical protein
MNSFRRRVTNAVVSTAPIASGFQQSQLQQSQQSQQSQQAEPGSPLHGPGHGSRQQNWQVQHM